MVSAATLRAQQCRGMTPSRGQTVGLVNVIGTDLAVTCGVTKGCGSLFILAQHQPDGSIEQVAPFLFYALAGLTCLSAWSIVFSQSIVRMSVYLLLTLTGAAGMYLMLNAELLAAIQLIVYAGGTLILIVFGVMLTSKSPFVGLRVNGWEIGLGVLIGLSIGGLLLFAWVHTPVAATAAGDGALGGGYGQVATVGRALLSVYMVPFEIAAVLLLVVMIGAAFMARQRAQ